MTTRGALIAGGGFILVAAAVALAAPRRYVVEGLSMAPGLMPGDVVSSGWLPAGESSGRPARNEIWVVRTPAGERAIKRVAGLPGEDVRIVSGDLEIDGRVMLKPPAALADLALAIPLPAVVGDTGLDVPPTEVLDDAAFAREVNRALEPVGDVGFAATVRGGDAPGRIVAGVGPLRVAWRIGPGERIRVLAGGLDGQLVATAWRTDRPAAGGGRPAIPGDAPASWSVSRARPEVTDGSRLTPHLRLEHEPTASVEEVVFWRDVHLRPAANGTVSWTLGAGEHLLLGDFPTGSVDSRQWGPSPRGGLMQRVSRRR